MCSIGRVRKRLRIEGTFATQVTWLRPCYGTLTMIYARFYKFIRKWSRFWPSCTNLPKLTHPTTLLFFSANSLSFLQPNPACETQGFISEKAASSRLPVITALEVEPLAPGIESIVHDGKQPSAPYSPPVIFRNKNLQLDDPLSVEPSYYRNKDGSAVFRPIHEQQQLLTPGQEVSRTSTVTASDDALNDPIALAPPPPIANWRNEHRRTSNF